MVSGGRSGQTQQIQDSGGGRVGRAGGSAQQIQNNGDGGVAGRRGARNKYETTVAVVRRGRGGVFKAKTTVCGVERLERCIQTKQNN